MDATGNHTARRWYVVEAKEGALDRARLNLAVAGLTIWAPIDVKRQANRSRDGSPRRDIRTPRFGRYFFIQCEMTPSLCNAVDNAAGVAGLLRACGTDEPAAVPEAVMIWVRETRAPEARAAPFVVGDRVRVVDGPFTGHEARVTDLDKKGIVKVDIEIFGRPTPIILEVGHVEMVQPAKSRAIETFRHRAKPKHGFRSGAAALAAKSLEIKTTMVA